MEVVLYVDIAIYMCVHVHAVWQYRYNKCTVSCKQVNSYLRTILVHVLPSILPYY